ncbi:MAG: ABC transporter ATP-binding protein/permease [Oscillospiraceae bacterium]|jgi:ATP-binding cassette subfamily B protein|nr:ABC transporter ATP-binding protein/permease [Oscillospiraceae bacterium]
MKEFIKPYRKELFLSLLFSTVGGVLALFVPFLIGKTIDFAVGENNVNFNKISEILLQMVIIVMVVAFCQWFNSIISAKFSYNTAKDLRINLFSKLQRLPVSKLDRHNKGDLVSRTVADCENISDGLLQAVTQFFTAVVTIIGTLSAMFFINRHIALYVLALTPLPLLTAHFIAISSKKFVGVMNVEKGHLTAFTEEYISNVKLVKTLTAEDYVAEKYAVLNKNFSKAGCKATFISSLANPCTRFVNGMIYAVIALIGALYVTDNALTVGALVAMLTYANQYTKPFNEISSVFTELQKAIKSAERVIEIEDTPVKTDKKTVSGDIIEFKNVTFGYKPNENIIENFSLKVEKGQKIAIIGKTGCGKTTLVNLLVGFYELDKGEILIDNVPVGDINLAEIMTCVMQDTWVFTGSIRENVAYGKPESTDEEIKKACKQAQVHKIIMGLPGGYDYICNENNVLSDGEKQLICIARAFLKNPPVIILDEATSSVDIETEKKISQALKELTVGRTSFVIAHRPETLKDADVVVELGKGVV